MPHVELSVSEPNALRIYQPTESTLTRWAKAVAGAQEQCLILDRREIVVAISTSFEELLGLNEPAVGRHVLDRVLRLIDFADGGALAEGDVNTVPPLLALRSGRLARGLLRIGCIEGACTFDAIATPLTDDVGTVGSLTFFSRV